MKFIMITLLIFCMSAEIANASVKLNDKMRSFSHAQKNGHCKANEELVLFERDDNIPGVVTEQWFTGTGCFQNDSIVRYYFDGETSPSIEGYVYMMHGIGFYNGTTSVPWGTKWMGHLAEGGGVYNTFRIPFRKSIRITLQSRRNDYFWYILRGMENYPVIVGDLELPENAQLRLEKIENKNFQPFDYILLASSSKSGGLLFMVALAAESLNFVYLEGCYRVVLSNDTKQLQYLSSGTEDFYMSAYYFNKGFYHTDHAGLTYFSAPGTMSAYKFFVDDPVIFKDEFRLIWRVSEKPDNDCYKQLCTIDENNSVSCEDPPGGDSQRSSRPSLPNPLTTQISSYVWYYEW